MNTSFNRTILLICFMVLVGFLASLTPPLTNLLAIIAAVVTPLGIYLGIKGKGSSSDNTGGGS